MKKMYDIVIAIILAFGAIISVAIFSNTIDKLNKKNQVVIVKGYAQVDRPIEEYNFVMSIKSKAKDVSSVYNALYEKEDRISANIDYKYTKEDQLAAEYEKVTRQLVAETAELLGKEGL